MPPLPAGGGVNFMTRGGLFHYAYPGTCAAAGWAPRERSVRQSMQQSLSAIPEFAAREDEVIRKELFASGQPAVLRGFVSEWPSVKAARRSAATLLEYLRRFDRGHPVDAVLTPPEVEGRLFYSEGLGGFNFVRNRLPLTQVAEQALRYAAFAHPPAVAAQSALIRDCLPGFSAENELTVIGADILPRIWLGTTITTPLHLDEWNNHGCVVSGRRRFTLFPPEQIENLYIGPLDFAPTGAPMSLVRLHEPDFARFPRFREALTHALSAELEAGDAIFIPPLWWHHVESLGQFNVLVNYWWHAGGGPMTGAASGFDSLLHAMLNLRTLPPHARAAWRALFERYVFGPQDETVEHIPAALRGILGDIPPETVIRLRAELAQRLSARK